MSQHDERYNTNEKQFIESKRAKDSVNSNIDVCEKLRIDQKEELWEANI